MVTVQSVRRRHNASSAPLASERFCCATLQTALRRNAFTRAFAISCAAKGIGLIPKGCGNHGNLQLADGDDCRWRLHEEDMADAVLPVNLEANEPRSPKSVVGLVARDFRNLMGHLKPISSSPDHPRAKTPWSPEMLLRKIGTAYDTEGPVHGGDPLRTPWSIQLGEKIGSACDTEGNVHGGHVFGAPSTFAAPERRRKVSFLLKGELVVPRDTSPPSRSARDDEPVDPSPKAVCKLDGRVAWVNAAWTRLSGYSQEELVGEDLLEKMRGPATDTAVVIVLTHHLARQQRTAPSSCATTGTDCPSSTRSASPPRGARGLGSARQRELGRRRGRRHRDRRARPLPLPRRRRWRRGGRRRAERRGAAGHVAMGDGRPRLLPPRRRARDRSHLRRPPRRAARSHPSPRPKGRRLQ